MGWTLHDAQEEAAYVAEENRIKAMPWYLKDRDGWPIEFVKGRGHLSYWIRVACQNIRKVVG